MDFVTFEIAKKLKEKGFQEECLCHYVNADLVYNIESPIANNQLWFCHNKYDNIWHRDNYDAPTISQVLKWLRRVEKLNVNMRLFVEDGWYFTIQNHKGVRIYSMLAYTDDLYLSYEEAAIAGIEYVIKNLI